MKKILITGKDSYIGTSFINYVKNKKEEYQITELDVRDEKWKETDFSKYDTIFHVAGIAHVSSDPKLEDLYYKVNRDLAIEVSRKAKEDGAKQIIFMSSMIIYGEDEPIGKIKIIDKDTNPSTENFYGKSKLEADMAIQEMNDEKYKAVIIRTPMVYGPGCKGNFPRLKKIAEKMPIFPDIDNQRSMIYIDNLCEFIYQKIEAGTSGIFYPQNREYMSTKEIINIMAETMGKKIHFTKIFNPIIRMLSKKVKIINKVFGNKVYKKNISEGFEYCVVNEKESIIRSIK